MSPAPSLYSSRTFTDIQRSNKMNILKVRDSKMYHVYILKSNKTKTLNEIEGAG